ncbi:MAG: hypothetical protein ACLFRI_03320 [Candidatus Izemoplasmataceae bacterium]
MARKNESWKRVYNPNKAALKTKQFIKKQGDSMVHKMLVFILFPIFIFVTSAVLFSVHAYFASIIIWMFLPLTFFLMMGSFINRVLNALPITMFIVYLLYGLETSSWHEGTLLFFLVPLGSLMLKPKKFPLQYAVLALSILVISINYFTPFNIPVYLKWTFSVIIYIVFLPPALAKKIEGFIEEQNKKRV